MNNDPFFDSIINTVGDLPMPDGPGGVSSLMLASCCCLAAAIAKMTPDAREEHLQAIEAGEVRKMVAAFEVCHSTPYPRVTNGKGDHQ
jgi:hypothetical protein